MRLEAPERDDAWSGNGGEDPEDRPFFVRRRADRHRRSRRERRRERRAAAEASPAPVEAEMPEETFDPPLAEAEPAVETLAVSEPIPETMAELPPPPPPVVLPPPPPSLTGRPWSLLDEAEVEAEVEATPEVEVERTPEVRVEVEPVSPVEAPEAAPPRPRTGGFVPDTWTTELEPPESRYRARTHRVRRRRRRARVALTVTTLVVLVGLVGSAVGVHLLRARHRQAPVSVNALPPTSLVWAVNDGHETFVTVVAVRGSQRPMAVVIPGGTAVDLPGGGAPTVGAAATTGPEALAAVQAVLDRRVGYYLWMSEQDLSGLVDALGGVTVQTEAAFTDAGQTLGPGPVKVNGAQAIAYLQQSTGTDATGRWEDVLSALLTPGQGSSAWPTLPGRSDGPGTVGRLLSGAMGAPVTELTVGQETLGLVPDPKALAALQSSLGRSLGPLIRVVVENGSGAPGLGDAVQQLLAPRGFRVVASQNLPKFDVAHTEIVAANASFLPWANAAQRLLGAGRVYVGEQATGIADLTIIVGKDFRAG